MGLADLRGREDEPALRELMELAHGSAAAARAALARYHDEEWRLVGWEERDEVVACAGVSRDSDRSVRVHAVAVAPARQRRGIGRALIDAVAAHAAGPRLVVETDRGSAGFFRRCGFTLEEGSVERLVCVRALTIQPGPAAAVHAFTLEEMERVIRSSWARETSDDPDAWTPANPARGQCVGTALLVRELLGGEILVADVISGGEWVDRHAWNRLPTGVAVDLTRSQFTRGERLSEPVVTEPVATHRSRYELLAVRVRERLAIPGS